MELKDELWQSLDEKIKIFKYKFIIKVEETINVPEFEGSTLRGGLGTALRKVICLEESKQECKNCNLSNTCPYAYIFNTSPNPQKEVLSKFSDIPRPFIVEPPFNRQKKVYKADEKIEFYIILTGRANDFLSYFVHSFRKLGEMGLGCSRGRYTLDKVYSINYLGEIETIVYDESTNKFNMDSKEIDWWQETEYLLNGINYMQKVEISLEFISMLRMKFHKKIVNVPEFHIILRNLFRRISSIALFHCDFKLDFNFTRAIEEAHKVILIEDETEWYKFSRYSKKQGRRFPLNGLIGKAKYKGNIIIPYLPFLVLGKYIHIGKGTVYGMGQYDISIIKEGKNG